MKVQICITLRDVFGGGAYVHLAANVSWCILTEQQLSAPTDFEFLPWDVFVFHTFHRSAYYPYLYIHNFSRSVFVVRTFSRSTFVFCTFSGNAYLYLCFILLVDMHIMLICISVSVSHACGGSIICIFSELKKLEVLCLASPCLGVCLIICTSLEHMQLFFCCSVVEHARNYMFNITCICTL